MKTRIMLAVVGASSLVLAASEPVDAAGNVDAKTRLCLAFKGDHKDKKGNQKLLLIQWGESESETYRLDENLLKHYVHEVSLEGQNKAIIPMQMQGDRCPTLTLRKGQEDVVEIQPPPRQRRGVWRTDITVGGTNKNDLLLTVQEKAFGLTPQMTKQMARCRLEFTHTVLKEKLGEEVYNNALGSSGSVLMTIELKTDTKRDSPQCEGTDAGDKQYIVDPNFTWCSNGVDANGCIIK